MTKSEGIMIFKDTMEYLIDGLLTPEQFAELMQLIYHTKWGEGVDEKTITDKQVLLVWKTLKHTIIKSVKNAKQYAKKQQEIQPNTEFDNEPQISENKGIITAEYPNPQPMEESVSDGQEMGKNEVPEIYEEDGDFRYGEIDTSDPNVSFLREDDEVFTKQETEPINEQKNKKDMDYTEAAKKYIEQMDGITFNSPEWHQKLYGIIKESEPPFRWGAIYETANKIMKNVA